MTAPAYCCHACSQLVCAGVCKKSAALCTSCSYLAAFLTLSWQAIHALWLSTLVAPLPLALQLLQSSLLQLRAMLPGLLLQQAPQTLAAQLCLTLTGAAAALHCLSHTLELAMGNQHKLHPVQQPPTATSPTGAAVLAPVLGAAACHITLVDSPASRSASKAYPAVWTAARKPARSDPGGDPALSGLSDDSNHVHLPSAAAGLALAKLLTPTLLCLLGPRHSAVLALGLVQLVLLARLLSGAATDQVRLIGDGASMSCCLTCAGPLRACSALSRLHAAHCADTKALNRFDSC